MTHRGGLSLSIIIWRIGGGEASFLLPWGPKILLAALSVRTNAIKLYNKFGMVTDCSFIKLPVGGHGTDHLTSDKVNLRIVFAV